MVKTRKKALTAAAPTAPTPTVRYGEDTEGEKFVAVAHGGKLAILHAAYVFGTAGEFAAQLMRRGIVFPNKQWDSRIQAKARKIVAAGKKQFVVTRTPGWLNDDCYLHGAQIVGHDRGNIYARPEFMQLGDRPSKFAVSGNLASWRDGVAVFATSQPLATFLLSAAFASMMLDPLGIQPFVVLLDGPSSIGKTTLAAFIGSVFGGDPSRPKLGYAETCKTTDFGLEKLGLSHNDAMLILDEFGRVAGTDRDRLKHLEAAVVDLVEGTPKTRGTDTQGGRNWKGVALITANESYADLLRAAGRVRNEALGPRLIELRADMGHGHGIFSQLPAGFSKSTDAIHAMERAASENYGVACRSFIEGLIALDPDELRQMVKRWRTKFAEWAGADLGGVTGHLRDKFAAIYAAGMLAKRLRVLPSGLKVFSAAKAMWTKAIRETRKSSPDEIIKAVADYVRRNSSQFEVSPLPRGSAVRDMANTIGIKHHNGGRLEYLFPTRVFERAFRQYGGPSVVMPILLDEGLAKVEDQRGHRWQAKRKIVRAGPRVRVYCLRGAVALR